MQQLIREYFINNFNAMTYSQDVKTTELRSIRYSQMLDWYIYFTKQNTCNCIESDADVLKILEDHKFQIKEFIVNGAKNG